MTFRADLPLYHGTNRPIVPGFSLTPETRATNAWAAREGVWAAENPQVAGVHADMAAPPGRIAGQNILPLFFRADRAVPVRIDPRRAGDPRPDISIAETIRNAFQRGYDALQFQNYPNIVTGQLGENAWVLKHPNQLRSIFARFDPTKRDSSDLMAGVALPGVAPAPGFRVEAEPNPLNGDTRSAWPNGASYRPFRSKPAEPNWPAGTPYRIRFDTVKDMVY